MFGYDDRRSAAERERDVREHDKREADKLLALGLLKNCVRPLLKRSGAEVGMAWEGISGAAVLLVEVDGVIYSLTAKVNHDGGSNG